MFSNPLMYIPAPPFSGFDLPQINLGGLTIGPWTIHLYGIIIALGVLVAAHFLRKRYVERGGSESLVDDITIWGIVCGFIGARIGYVILKTVGLEKGETFSTYFIDNPIKIFYVWEGGIAIMGGLFFGGLTVFYMLRKNNAKVAPFFDSLAPTLPLAQAIGRWGNYFNQELYGVPTDNVPWKLYIEEPHRRPGFEQYEFFHPTFLYESLGNLLLALLIFYLDKKGKVVEGGLICVYGLGYGSLRFIMELIRIDTSFRFIGLSTNAWVALIFALLSAFGLYTLTSRKRERELLAQKNTPEETGVSETI